ncbi:MAG: hypothetical protein ACR65W_19370 [Methylocystis sp.]|uniref:hypothetical protein n=1 Tax=Methylocystis sp. TaxID=1911079 RepID=UPI003DA2AE99
MDEVDRLYIRPRCEPAHIPASINKKLRDVEIDRATRRLQDKAQRRIACQLRSRKERFF